MPVGRMKATSLRERLLVATLPAEERENGRRFLAALSLVEEKLRRVEDELLGRTRSHVSTIGQIGSPV